MKTGTILIVVMLFAALCIGSAMAAVPGTVVWATTDNTVNADNASASWWSPGTNWGDSLWMKWKGGVAGITPEGIVGWDSWTNWGTAENSPKIKTTATGLDPAKTYDIYLLYFVSPPRTDFAVQAAFAGQTLQRFDHTNGADTGDRAVWVTNSAPIWSAKLGQVSGVYTVSIDVDDAQDAYETLYWGLSYDDGSVGDLKVHVDRSNWAPVDTDPKLAPVKIELSKGGVVVKSEIVVLSSSNDWIVERLEVGDWEVTVSGLQWVRTRVPVTVLPSQQVTCNVVMPNGDVDGDGEVTTTDLSAAIINIDTQGN